MPGQFFSPEGDLEEYFITNHWLIDQYIGDELYVWGSNESLNLGTIGIGTVRSTPTQTSAGGTNWVQVSCGGEDAVTRNYVTAAIKTDGTLWTWGRTGVGINRAFGSEFSSTPVTTFAGGTNWKQLSVGTNTVMAIKTDGTLWGWGVNSDIQLGNNVDPGGSPSILTPITTFAGGSNWRSVACCETSSMAIKTDGTLWGWGANGSGQLGTNDALRRSTPVTTFIGGNDWKQISVTDGFSTAIKTDSTLWTWGGNSLMVGDLLGSRQFPRKIAGTNWKQVSVEFSSVAAIKEDGTLWVWGRNELGQLGINNVTSRSTPVTTFAGGTNWKQVSCGGRNMVAIKTNGTLWVWGENTLKALGNFTATGIRSTPITTFAGGTNWKQADSSLFYMAAITSGIPSALPLS